MRRTLLHALSILALAALGCDGDSTSDAGAQPDARARDSGSPADGARPRDADPPRPDTGPTPAACALPTPFDVGVTYERTLHVSTGGSDSADGSEGAPLATLREAARRATPGTRIVMAAGTYGGSTYLEGLRGEATRPIAIVADGDVVLDAGGAGEVLHVTDPRYLVIEGLTIQNASVNGLNIDDGGSPETPAEHVVLRGLTVRDVGTGGNNDCIKLSGLDRFFVLGSDISACNAGDAIDMVGCHEGVISGNDIHDALGGGIQAKGGSADTVIHGNRFRDVRGRSVNAGGSTGLEFFRPIDAPYEAARLRVVANVFVRSGESSGAPIAYVGCDACVFANNTIVEPLTWVARILQETTDARFVPCRDGVFANNLVVLNAGVVRAIVNVGGNTAPETFTFANDLWWALDRDASWAGPSIDSSIPPEVSPVIQEDPELADLAGGDYRISATSPAAGAGRAITGAPYPDFDGRCYDDPPAIGAFTTP